MGYYEETAQHFAARINEIFATEETLKALFHSYFPLKEDGSPTVPFDRTDHWNGILTREATKSWQAAGPAVVTNPTQQDIYKILKALHPLLDFNLYTQVALNLQNYVGFAYRSGDANKELTNLRGKWKEKRKDIPAFVPGYDPFEPKAKMMKEASKEGWTAELNFEYNADLSAIKALRIISNFGPLSSFRVSPKGSTPAFADSKNLSTIGIGGDRYLQTLPGLKAYYIVWNETTNLLVPESDGGFTALGIPYKFYSKSGGAILNEVLYSRWLAYQVWGTVDMVNKSLTVIPRMKSVMVIGPHVPELEQMVKTLKEVHKIELHAGARPANVTLS